MQKLLSALSPWQTGCLRQGIYGTSTEWALATPDITITSYPGERATVNGNPHITPAASGSTISYLNINLNNALPAFQGACGGQTQQVESVLIDADDAVLENNNIYESGVSVLERFTAIGVGWNPGAQHSISGVIIRYNRIHDYAAHCDHGHGIYLSSVDHSRIYGNWIYGGYYGGAAVQLYDGYANSQPHDNQIYDNVFDHVGLGVYLWSDEPSLFTNNTIYHNVITHTGHYGGFVSDNGTQASNSFSMNDGLEIAKREWPCGDSGGCGSVAVSGNLAVNPDYTRPYVGNNIPDFTVNATELANWGLPTAADMG